MKTFIYHDGALGDTLLSLPCISALRAGSSRLEIAGRRDVTEFLQQAAFVDAGLSTDRALFLSLYAGVSRELRDYLERFDCAYFFSVRPASPACGALRSVIPRTFAIRTVPDKNECVRHAAEYRLSQLDASPAFLTGPCFAPLDAQYLEQAETILRTHGLGRDRLFAVHPGSGGPGKCWPVERYFELIDRLQSLCGAHAVLFSGDAENKEFKGRIDTFAASRKGVLHAADFRLMSAAALLSRCRLYIGNDSGFSHLAARFCPSLVLFGSSDPELWKPLGRDVGILSSGMTGMNAISPDAVMGRAREYFQTERNQAGGRDVPPS